MTSHKAPPEYPLPTWPASWEDDTGSVMFEEPIPDSLWRAGIELAREAAEIAEAAAAQALAS